MYLQATWIWKHAGTGNDAACLARDEGGQCCRKQVRSYIKCIYRYIFKHWQHLVGGDKVSVPSYVPSS